MRARIAYLTGIACGAAALSLAAPAFAAPAGVTEHPAATGTEHFQLVGTSTTSSTGHVIAYGAFTGAAAVDHMGRATAKFVFSNGSFKVSYKHGKGGTESFSSKTCLVQASQPGTYTISGGTGKYKGISGHGKFTFTLLAIGAKNGQGKCVHDRPPAEFQVIIHGSGPVTL
jgi:hypothetical protein